MDPNQKLIPMQSEPFSNLKRYRKIVEKLIYLTRTRPALSFVVGVVNQLMQAAHHNHSNVVFRRLLILIIQMSFFALSDN